MYVFFVFLLILLLFILNSINKKNYNIPIALVITLILIAGFRKNGYDLENYFINFLEINSLKDVLCTIFEPGYALFVLILKKFLTLCLSNTDAFTAFILFIAAVSITLKCKTINKFSKLPIVAFLFYYLCFFIYNDFTQIRHGIAIAFCFYSLNFVNEEKPLKYFICVIIASLFHYSAFCFFPIYFLRKINIDKKKFLIIILVSFVGSLINIKEIILFLNNFLIHSSYIGNKLALYTEDSICFFNYSNIFKIIFVGFYLYFIYDKSDTKEKICVNTYIAGIFLFNLLCSYSILAYRVNAFFRMVEVVLLSNYIYKLKNDNVKYKKLNVIFVIAVICYYMYKFVMIAINPNYLIYRI